MDRERKKQQSPKGKISEVFLNFSKPILDSFGKAQAMKQANKILMVTYIVWNVVVFDEMKGGEEHIS